MSKTSSDTGAELTGEEDPTQLPFNTVAAATN